MSSGPPKRQPDSSGATPPPRDAMANFRARAEEILAISGGLNDKSRPLLLALATELGLQQSQFQDAVRSILSGEQTKSASDDSGSSDGKGRDPPPDQRAALAGRERDFARCVAKPHHDLTALLHAQVG